MPYLLYTVAIYTLWKWLYNLPVESLPYVLAYMNSTGFIAAALWFLTALFLANCGYWILDHCIKNVWILSGLVAFSALLGCLLHHFLKEPYFLAYNAAMVGVGIMHLGFLFKNMSIITLRMKCLSWPKLSLGFVINGILILLNSPVNMRTGEYGIIPLFWLNAIGCSILLWILSFKLNKLKLNSKVTNEIISFIVKIGKRSLTFLSLNQVIIFWVFKIFPVDSSGGLWILLHNTVSLIAVICILYIIAFTFEVIKNKFFNRFHSEGEL